MARPLDELREHIAGLSIIDTHEHLWGRETARDMRQDVLGEYLSQYFSADLVSAGLPLARMPAVRDPEIPLAKRWAMVEPYWRAAQDTGYGRSLRIAARDLYGVESIDAKTIGRLNEAFCAARAAGNTYQHVLKDRSKIRLSLLDAIWEGHGECDRRFFVPVLRVNSWLSAATQASLDTLAALAGMNRIHSLEDMEASFLRVLERESRAGLAGLKCAIAYERPLTFAKPTRAQAEEQLNAIWSREGFIGSTTRGNAWLTLSDHMMHFICRAADERGLAFQVHTGLQEGSGNYLAHSDPLQLTNLFMEYRQVKFDLFHVAYPFTGSVAALAKNFANVFIDFAWMHIISPAVAVEALGAFLDSVPANKINGFGGDYVFVDGVYGHQVLARENIARSLAGKVKHDVFDLDRARELANMILHDNPVRIFDLQRFLKATPAKKTTALTTKTRRH
jgi:hypothetical protein